GGTPTWCGSLSCSAPSTAPCSRLPSPIRASRWSTPRRARSRRITTRSAAISSARSGTTRKGGGCICAPAGAGRPSIGCCSDPKDPSFTFYPRRAANTSAPVYDRPMKRDGRPVGVICAMAEEMALLQTHLVSATETAVAGLQFRSGLLFDVPAVLTPAGIGKVNAALVATVLADRFQARAILFSGVAGGLDPALGIGDVVIADPLVQHDYGAIVAGRMRPYRPGAMPIRARRSKLGFALPAGLRAIAQGAGAGLRVAHR